MRRHHSVVVWAMAIFAMVLPLAVTTAPPASAALCDSACIYNQLVNNQIPMQQGDGVKQSGPLGMGWWLYYTGPNGLEIRLGHDTTWNVISSVGKAEIGAVTFAATGTASLADVIVGAAVPSKLQLAAELAWGSNSWIVSAIAQKAIQQDFCLGMTIPGGSLGASLQRATNLMGGQFIGALQPLQPADIKIWFEPCSLNRSAGLADTASPASLGVLGLAPQAAVNAMRMPVASATSNTQMIRTTGSGVYAKNAIGMAGWSQEAVDGNATKIAAGGGIQMFLRGDGAVYAKDSLGAGGWVREAGPGSATDIAVSSTGLQMVIAPDASIYAKKGIGEGGWTQEVGAGNAAAIAVGGDTQLFLRGDSAVFARNGIGNGGWTQETAPQTAKAIVASSTGLQMILTSDNQVWAKKGIGYGGWIIEGGPGIASAIAVGGDTQMIITGDASVFAKNTIGSGGWNRETDSNNAIAIAVSSTGVQMFLRHDKKVFAKSTIGNGGWIPETDADTAVGIAANG